MYTSSFVEANFYYLTIATEVWIDDGHISQFRNTEFMILSQ